RLQQDNEQWHLLILEELIDKRGIREGFFWYWLVPQAIAFLYYQIVWLLYVARPARSYQLNADFEDHAEHEYMEFVREHPELEAEPCESMFRADCAPVGAPGDVFRPLRQHG